MILVTSRVRDAQVTRVRVRTLKHTTLGAQLPTFIITKPAQPQITDVYGDHGDKWTQLDLEEEEQEEEDCRLPEKASCR